MGPVAEDPLAGTLWNSFRLGPLQGYQGSHGLSAPRLTCRRKLPELLVEVDPQPAEPRLKGSPLLHPPSSPLDRGEPKEAEAQPKGRGRPAMLDSGSGAAL